jgi:hypothetical protein
MSRLIKLESLPNESSWRFFSEAQLAADPELVAAGWERRFTADSDRAAEAIALYAELGYEVRAEAIRGEEVHDDCNGCHSHVVEKFKTIYTRKRER